MPKLKKPITIREKHYPSMSAAAKTLGMTYEAIRRAARENRLDTVGLRNRRKK